MKRLLLIALTLFGVGSTQANGLTQSLWNTAWAYPRTTLAVAAGLGYIAYRAFQKPIVVESHTVTITCQAQDGETLVELTQRAESYLKTLRRTGEVYASRITVGSGSVQIDITFNSYKKRKPQFFIETAEKTMGNVRHITHSCIPVLGKN